MSIGLLGVVMERHVGNIDSYPWFIPMVVTQLSCFLALFNIES